MNSCKDNCVHKIDGQHTEERYRCSRLYPDLYEEKKEYRIEKRIYGKIIAIRTVYSFEAAKEAYRELDDRPHEEDPTFVSSVTLLFVNGKRIRIPETEKLFYTAKERQKTLYIATRNRYKNDTFGNCVDTRLKYLKREGGSDL